MPASTSLRLSQVAFSGLSCLLTAGLIFGFAALKPVLIHEDVYGDLCPNDAARDAARQSGRPCVEQDLQLNLSFTISVVLTNVAALPIGVLLDNVGPRTTSIAGAILFALGNFTLGFQRGEGLGRILDPFLTGYILLAIGGPMIFLSSFHLCNTFPKRSGLILSSIIGAFDASSLPFVVYAALYKKSGHTIHLRQWFWLYTLIPAVIIVFQIFFGCPKPYTRDSNEKSGTEETDPLLAEAPASGDRRTDYGGISTERDSLLRVNSRVQSRNASALHRHPSFHDSQFSRLLDFQDQYDGKLGGGVDANISHDDPITGALWGKSARSQIASIWFWLAQAFLVCYMLRINFYIATVADQVLYYTSDPELAARLTDAFVLLLPLAGVASIPLVGYLLDRCSSAAAFLSLLALGLVFGVGTLTSSVTAQLIGIVAFVVMRPLMYTAVSDYFTKVIGIETFGTVYGLANATSGVFTLVQYAFDYAVKRPLHGNYTPINSALLILGAALAIGLVAKMRLHARDKAALQAEEAVED